MTEGESNPQGNEFRLLDFQDRCPDCDVAVGEAHIHDEVDGGCDVARCLVTGLQRLMCEADHDCGRDVWTGWWPGQVFSELNPGGNLTMLSKWANPIRLCPVD